MHLAMEHVTLRHTTSFIIIITYMGLITYPGHRSRVWARDPPPHQEHHMWSSWRGVCTCCELISHCKCSMKTWEFFNAGNGRNSTTSLIHTCIAGSFRSMRLLRIDPETRKFSASKIGLHSALKPLYCRGLVIWTSILENKILEMFSLGNLWKFSGSKITRYTV